MLLVLTGAAENSYAYDTQYKEFIRKLALEKLKSEPPLKPFRQSELDDKALCRFVATGLKKVDEHPVVPIFSQLDGVYIWATKRGTGGLNIPFLSALPTIADIKLAQLTGCVYENRLHMETKSVPVYVPLRDALIGDWHEAKQDRKLLVWVEISYEKIRSQRSGSLVKFMLLHVRYYRHDLHSIDNVATSCLKFFPYMEEKNLLLREVTRAIEDCSITAHTQ